MKKLLSEILDMAKIISKLKILIMRQVFHIFWFPFVGFKQNENEKMEKDKISSKVAKLFL